MPHFGLLDGLKTRPLLFSSSPTSGISWMPLIRLSVPEAEGDDDDITSMARETYIPPGITIADFKASALMLVHDRGVTEPIYFSLDSPGSGRPALWQTPETLLELLKPYLESKDRRGTDTEFELVKLCLGDTWTQDHDDEDTAVLEVSIESYGESRRTECIATSVEAQAETDRSREVAGLCSLSTERKPWSKVVRCGSYSPWLTCPVAPGWMQALLAQLFQLPQKQHQVGERLRSPG